MNIGFPFNISPTDCWNLLEALYEIPINVLSIPLSGKLLLQLSLDPVCGNLGDPYPGSKAFPQ